ncbi:MAG: 2-dehydro-3-deoxygalactonokinase, partial [Verrucomicrobia bacterium]|nr:2-dehydro-3-deoxygalactonokinase [Verrucomicrobiota bacterium]
EFLSGDWGSARLRWRWATIADGSRPESVAVETAQGAAVVAGTLEPTARRAAFQSVLHETITRLEEQLGRKLDDCPVVISGMATSSYGWIELPYASLPFSMDTGSIISQTLQLTAPGGARRDAHLLSGVRADDDVMRGEECQLLGLYQDPSWVPTAAETIVLLPGTHGKHARLRRRHLVDFTTYMTGELVAILGEHSVLRHSLRRAAWPPDADGLAAFQAGFELASTYGATAGFFKIRAASLLGQRTPESNSCALNGLLLADEFRNPMIAKSTADIMICAGTALTPWYEAAVQAAGLASRTRVIPPAAVDGFVCRSHAAFLRCQSPTGA